ncbi:hypothetical protein RO3G_10438 [Rhizopus delemar RA 99-880]|uniref:Uncharacterized protein n=1 Tax=Rhizopus delemar (strain RA 99-880 / ATCC MYA-4621 / FGSC 9543 / NRRL 43880) TaxID=246409 RepID=I1CB98_RHIO9|nr:hypothetical protein RO3G_10438 [Rhizopus delemar RA 99-880]|eukprot:EIE85728.1 hypothetical protein RO3G_10438 [Rhizopus delemar RA 99-880]
MPMFTFTFSYFTSTAYNKRSSTIKSFGCFNSLFITMVCPSLFMPNQGFKASYWSGILDKHVYEFGMACGKSCSRSLTPLNPFRSRNKN